MSHVLIDCAALRTASGHSCVFESEQSAAAAQDHDGGEKKAVDDDIMHLLLIARL